MCLQFLPRDVMHITRTMLLQDVRPSVRLSVPHTPVLCRNGQTYHYTFFYQLSYRRSHNSTACSGFKRDWAAEKEKERRFSTIKSLYLVNDSRSAYIYTRKSHMGFQLVPISITLNDRNAPSYTHSFSGVRCMKTDPYCQRQKGSPGSVNEFVPTSIYGSKGSSRGLYRSAKFCCNRFGGGGVKIRHFQLTWPVAVSSGTILRTAQPVTTLTATSFNQNLCSLQRLAK